MKRRFRRLSREQFEELWRRWKQRETLAVIGAALACSLYTVNSVVRRHGGIAPPPRRRARWALRLTEREEISRGIAAHRSVRAMARALGRPPSTISREIRRHGGRAHSRATTADETAWRRATRPKICRLRHHVRLRHVVAAKLRSDWSPEQIAAWLREAYPHDPTMRISHETIYRTLYVQARGALKQELVRHLRRHRTLRRPGGTRAGQGQGQIAGAISIAERPPAVADRAVPGHWEGDLLLGGHRSQIATLVEHDKTWYEERLPILEDRVRVRLGELSSRLGDADWLDDAFSAGDLLMVTVLRRLNRSGILEKYPNLSAYVARGEARPAYKRAFDDQLAVFTGKPPTG